MKKIVLILVALMLVATMVSAQNEGDLGLVYRFDPAPQVWANTSLLGPSFNYQNVQGLGMIYHFSDQFAIYPTLLIGFVKATTEFEPNGGDTVDVEEESLLVFGVEVDVPIYLKRVDNVSVFLAPGLRLVSSVNDYEDKQNSANDETVRLLEFGGSVKLGGQVTFNRFAVFSSYGLRFDYGRITIEENGGDIISKGPAFGTTQMSIGLIYYVGDDA